MTKCHLLILGRQHLHRPPKDLFVDLFDHRIVAENSISLLGVKLDDKLSFNEHVTDLIRKCDRNIRFLWRTARDRSRHHRLLLANALVGSHLSYCDTVYHRHISVELSRKLDSIQYRVMRFIMDVKRDERISRNGLLADLSWIPLHKHRDVKLMRLLWKIQNNWMVPQYLRDQICKSPFYNTRFASHSLAMRNDEGKTLLNNLYCCSYTKLSDFIRRSRTLSTFSNRLIGSL